MTAQLQDIQVYEKHLNYLVVHIGGPHAEEIVRQYVESCDICARAKADH